MQQFNETRPAPSYSSWEVAKDFVAESSSAIKLGVVCVRVNTLRLEFPRYSYSVGWKYPNGEFKLHFQSDHPVHPGEVVTLLTNAQEYVKEEVSKIEAVKSAKEADRMKYEEDRWQKQAEKKKRYEGNIERRKVENRERASRSGSGKKK